MHAADGTLQPHYGSGVLGAGAADIKVPTELKLALSGELTVDQRVQFLPGRTIGHVIKGRFVQSSCSQETRVPFRKFACIFQRLVEPAHQGLNGWKGAGPT